MARTKQTNAKKPVTVKKDRDLFIHMADRAEKLCGCHLFESVREISTCVKNICNFPECGDNSRRGCGPILSKNYEGIRRGAEENTELELMNKINQRGIIYMYLVEFHTTQSHDP